MSLLAGVRNVNRPHIVAFYCINYGSEHPPCPLIVYEIILSAMPALIGHVDADCYYVSCERVRHSHFQNLPLAVLGNWGACVIAKSYELKAKGVKTGMPIWDAGPLCPHAVFLKRDFEWYEALSRRMFDAIKLASPLVEYYSIDEMFFDANRVDPSALQEQIQVAVGVPVTVGISRTRTLAKLVSDEAKPHGCRVIVNESDISVLLASLPVDSITGIANRSAQKLAGWGIQTCKDFAAADRRLIRRLLTKRGEDLWWEINGTPVVPIHAARLPHKAIGRGGSVGKATDDPARCTAWVIRNVERLIEAIDIHQVYCDRLTLELDFQDGSRSGGCLNLPCSTADFHLIAATALDLWVRHWRGQPLSYMQVIADGLSTRQHVQLSLFNRPSSKERVVADAKRRINEAMGRFVLRSGATLPLLDVYGDEANSYDICDVQGKTCF